ncbi:MAG: hypothetical protein EBW11_11190 [Betaproteobacteria bacterium]|nr:hypothetical protein [Betaproteobacteria bacterium]
MRKFLAIFLLVLLPLQFSWAAVAGYCQHEAGVTANHPGHHLAKMALHQLGYTTTVRHVIWVAQLR